MSFVSLEFLIFFLIVIPLYFIIPFRFRWVFLLVASYIFYAYWNGIYVGLIVFTTLIDYTVARLMERTDRANKRQRQFYLSISLIANLGLLFYFKYFNFFAGSLDALFSALHMPYVIPTANVLLPIGISFYTFQEMAYTISVYRGTIPAERHLGIFASFIAFFPQLVAGPIERAGHMLPQFRVHHRFEYDRVVSGFRLILWGIFKKVVIADRLAAYVNTVYNSPHDYFGPTLLMATVFFAFQIYCDFSGYSDIAIGTARILGFDLMINFRQPYLSRSLLEFWRRWHISLTTWIREFLFFPLSRALLVRTHRRNPRAVEVAVYVIVMTVVGLWHGAAWTFVLWGLLHGIYMAVETLLNIRPAASGTPAWRIPVTFALVCLAWIFFRANSIGDAFYIVQHLFDFSTGSHSLFAPFPQAFLSPRVHFVLAWILIAGLIAVDWLDARYNLIAQFSARPALVRWAVYYGLIGFLALSFLEGASTQPFIYFQF